MAQATSGASVPVDVVRVESRMVARQVKLPGEFRAYLSVPIHAKIAGFVDKVDVDRGSIVRKGHVLAILTAPEMAAQLEEAKSKALAVELQRAEAQAKLDGVRSTYEKLKAASATPGVVAGNDVVIAGKNVEAAQALVRVYENSLQAAQSSVKVVKDMEAYLTVTAPFDGVIVERNVHPGALVGPASQMPMLKLQQVSRLRLVVAVPEALVGGIPRAAEVAFTVPAFPGETFHGTVARIAHSLDEQTRSMAVEIDVGNPEMRLAPGMYPEVQWPIRRARPSLLVPPTSIVTTTERTFVIRVRDGVVEWVNVSRGALAGDLVEVFGALQAGDTIIKRGSDELREGTHVTVKK